MNRQATGRQTDNKQTDKQADIYTYNRQTDRQTDKQSNSLAVLLRFQHIETQDGNDICKAWSELGAVSLPVTRPDLRPLIRSYRPSKCVRLSTLN